MTTRRQRLSRREMIGAGILAAMILVVEVVLVLSYLRGAETNQRFGATSTLITSLANVQREVLRLHVEVDRLVTDAEADWPRIQQQNGILRGQIRNVLASAAGKPEVLVVLRSIQTDADVISAILIAHDRASDPALLVGEMDDRLAVMERAVKGVYDREEIAYFRSTSDSLATQASSQLVLVIVAVAIAGLAIALGVLLRRRLKDEFAKAFFRLEAEMGERERAERALRHQANHDALTGAPNRTLFLERLNEAVHKDAGARAAVLFVDLDDFKTINDRLGHAAGDLLLTSVADRIRSCLRTEDMAARLGGDEFAVLLATSRSHAKSQDVARRILEALRRPFALGGETVLISATIGIAESAGGTATDLTADELLRNADLAMYSAKKSGKNRSETFRVEMHQDALRRLTIRTELERALQLREFVVYYQPIVDLTDGSFVGVEALIRWQHPERGLVAPGDFIPIAEESGLIVPIGRWVLDDSTKRVAGWIRDGIVGPTFTLSVNLSPRQLQDERLFHDVQAAIRRSGIAAGCLTLEMTETLLVDDVASAATSLQRLKELGVQLAIDDFGTGYSSLSYLSRFPIDILKVDRSFVAAAFAETGSNAVLARTIIGLGNAVGLPTVAEGIEEPGQVALVRELGCQFGQGYLFARPADAATTAELLRNAAPVAVAPVPPHRVRGRRTDASSKHPIIATG